MRRSIFVVAVAAILAAAPAVAQETRTNLYNKFEFSPSLTSVILNSNIRVDSEDGSVGTDVDAEDDLGLEKVKWEPRFALRWRPGHRHEIEVGYQFARSVLDEDGSYGNPIFSRYQDMRVYLGFNIGLDSLYKSFAGESAESGVIRATNERRLVLSF